MSFESDTDEEIDAAEIEEEEWIDEALEKMENEKIRCWKMTQRKIKWRFAMRINLTPSERWLIQVAEWNPELSSKYRTNRAMGRPRKRWEDDINELLKLEENGPNAATKSIKIGSTQQKTAEDGLYSRKTTLRIQKEDMKNNTRARRNSHNIPARYVNGVKLSDEELADII